LNTRWKRFAWAAGALLVLLGPSPARAIARRKDAVFSFGSPACVTGMIQGVVYDLPPGTRMLPTFEAMKPVGALCTFTLNVPTRSWIEGIPGVSSRIEWFAIDYHADFWVEVPGSYMFTLDSDDGSVLYVDGRLIVDDDGVHSTQHAGGRARLATGMHHLRVSYFQGPRWEVALVLNVAPPHGQWKIFDIRDYRMPAKGKAPAPTGEDDQQRPILRRAETAHDPLAQQLFERPAMAALEASPRPHVFAFRVSALRFRPGPSGSQYSIAVEVPGSSVKITQGADLKCRLHIVILVLIKDAEGQVVEKVSQNFPFEIPDGRLAAFEAGSFSYTRAVTLPPGRYTLEAAVADREADQASVRTLQFENPEYGGVAVSDLLLVKKLEEVKGQTDAADPLEYGGKRAMPELGGTVRASAHPFIYFMVYPDAAVDAKPHMEVEVSLGDHLVASQTAELPAPDASGAIPMSIATVTDPGKYAIKIAIQQGTQRVERHLTYSVTAP
jgi:hypothetical protein